MSDFFNVGNLDGQKNFPGEASDVNPQALTQQAALARLAEGGSSAPESSAAPAQAGGSDGINFSELGDVDGASAASGLLAAWGAPTPPSSDSASGLVGGFQMQQGPPPGFQSGGVFGANGSSGQEPGMQSGAVYCTPYQSAS